jgi:hypothetical protein
MGGGFYDPPSGCRMTSIRTNSLFSRMEVPLEENRFPILGSHKGGIAITEEIEPANG